MFGADALPYRIKAITALRDGKPIGIGGIIFRPDGVWASLVLPTEEAKRIPVTLVRAVRRLFAEAAASGIRRIYAVASGEIARSAEFLAHLGFKPLGHDGTVIYLWEPPADVE